MEDTRKELERLEKELLEDMEDEQLDQELEQINELLAEPAFDDPETIHEPKEPMVYCNYSNDYGKNLQDFADNGGQLDAKKNDKTIIGLLIAACCLSAGILAMLIYWLAVFLK